MQCCIILFGQCLCPNLLKSLKFSHTKWWCTSICLVLACIIGLEAMFIVVMLSQWMLIASAFLNLSSCRSCCSNHKASLVPSASERYFASVELRATVGCLRLLQVMGTPPAIKMYADVEHLLSASPARSESVKPSMLSGTSFLKRIPRSVVLGDIAVDVSRPPCAASGVTAWNIRARWSRKLCLGGCWWGTRVSQSSVGKVSRLLVLRAYMLEACMPRAWVLQWGLNLSGWFVPTSFLQFVLGSSVFLAKLEGILFVGKY